MKSYDPKKVIITFGPLTLVGFAADAFLNADFNDDIWTVTVGADGEVVRSLSNDETLPLTCTLLASSISNAQLSALVIADRKSGDGVFPFGITDLALNSLVSSKEAFVKKMPPFDRAKAIGNVVWPFILAKGTMIHGSIL